MTTMKQAEKRAAELTNAEAKMLCRHCPGELYGCHKFGWPDTGDDAFSRAGRVLMSAGLIQWAPNPRDSRTQLTRFGLAVRAAAIASREHRSASHDAD
jgi:hypothetical protein